MSVVILITLVCVILYALYLHWAPISSGPDGLADRIVNSVAPVLWVASSIALAIVLVPAQETLFATIVFMTGCAAFMMVVEALAVLLLFCFFSWVSLSLFQCSLGCKSKSRNTKVEEHTAK